MIEIFNIQTSGWDTAIRGMRNSYDSWDKSDSVWEDDVQSDGYSVWKVGERVYRLGNNDLELAARLSKLGSSESKFRRMIHVFCDIKAPLYWWKQFDTYKVGTVCLSTSTMHSITKRDFVIDDFSMNQYMSAEFGNHMLSTINILNELRKRYLECEDPTWKKMYWSDIIQLLPESYNQLRTIDMNYEVLSHMVDDRLYHKLNEWQEFCRKMLANLPYARELIFDIQVDPDPQL